MTDDPFTDEKNCSICGHATPNIYQGEAICDECIDKGREVADEIQSKDQDEGLSQDEIFGDDCDTEYRMSEARKLK